MKKLMLLTFVLFAFNGSAVFAMKKVMKQSEEPKKDMVSVSVHFSYLEKNITVYFNKNKFEKLHRDLNLNDYDSLKEKSIRKRTINSLFSEVYLNLSDSNSKASCYIPSTRLKEIYKEGYDLKINFVKADEGKYQLVIDAVKMERPDFFVVSKKKTKPKKEDTVSNRPYVKIKMWVIATNVPSSEKKVSIYIYTKDYEKLKRDSRYKNEPEATLRLMDKYTIDNFSVNLPMKLNDSDDVILGRISLEDAEFIQSGIIEKRIKYVMGTKPKKPDKEKKE